MQSKIESAIEQVCNVFSGMALAYCTIQFVFVPLEIMEVSAVNNVITTVVLTVLSVIRGYIWRRFFNKRIMKKYTRA